MSRTKEWLLEDWERDFEKDLMYQMENQWNMEQEYYESIRKPAQIIVNDQRIIKKEEHETGINILPF